MNWSPTARYIVQVCVLVLGSLWVGQTTLAFPVITITEETQLISIGRHVELLEDKTAALSFDDVQQSAAWQPSKTEEPNFGFTRSAWWARTRIIVNEGAKDNFYVLVDDAILNHVDIYFIDTQRSITHHQGGGFTPVSERSQPYRNHAYALPGQGPRTVEVYFRVESQLAVVLPLRIVEADYFTQMNTTISWIYALYIGFLSAMLVFNLMVGVRLIQSINLLYSGFTLSMILFGLSFSGYGRQFLWPSPMHFDNFMLSISISLCAIFPTLFNEKFLFDMKRDISSVPYICRWIVCTLGGICILFSLAGIYHFAIIFGALSVVSGVLFFIINSVIAVMAKVHGAKFLLMAWSGILIGSIVFALRGFGLLPSNLFTTYSVQFSSMLESFLLMMAIIDKSRHTREELEAANEAAKQELQQQVEARTSALRQAQQQFIDNERRQSLVVFAAGVAHEINNPANFIAAGAQDALARSQGLHTMLKDMLDEDADPHLVQDIDHRFAEHARHYQEVLDHTRRITHAVAELRAQNPETR